MPGETVRLARAHSPKPGVKVHKTHGIGASMRGTIPEWFASVQRTQMLNRASAQDASANLDRCVTKPFTAQRVVIVNGDAAVLEVLETAFEAGHYHMTFLESNDGAYSHIKHIQPDLVILCLHFEDPVGFHVMSMLKLDDATRDIPVLTYTTEYERARAADDVSESWDTEILSLTPAARMN